MLKRIEEAPEYNYSDFECSCDFFLQETGIYVIRVQGYFTMPCARFICETLPEFQKWLMNQPHFLYLIVDIQATESWAEARNYVLKKLRWKYSGRALKSYVIHQSPLAYSIFELARKINNRTRFEATMSFEQALQDITVHYQSLNQNEQSIQMSVPQGLSPEQELRSSRYISENKKGQVRFYKPTEQILYLVFAGRISKDLLNYVVPTCRGMADNMKETHERYAIMVDLSHGIQTDKSLLFSTYKYGFEKAGGRNLYFIGPAYQNGFIRWLGFALNTFFRKAQSFKDYAAAYQHFSAILSQITIKPSRLKPYSQSEEIERLQELCEQQQTLLRKQAHSHSNELTHIQKIIWTMLLKENNTPVPINIPDEEGPYTGLLHILDTFQQDQILFVQELQQQIDERARAEQTAASANDIKGKFLASMSHEIRTPLNAILGFTRAIQINDSEPLSSNQKLYLKRIQDNGKNLLQLVNNILDLSHLESGKMPLNLTTIKLHKTLKEVARQLDILAYSKGLSIELELPHCILYTDEERLRQIVVNLLNNAIKYTSKGHIKIWCDSKEGQATALHIQDTGCGIEKKDQQRIFSAFEQIDTYKDGAGLGLAISSTLASSLGHRLDFKSIFGKGSTFSLYF